MCPDVWEKDSWRRRVCVCQMKPNPKRRQREGTNDWYVYIFPKERRDFGVGVCSKCVAIACALIRCVFLDAVHGQSQRKRNLTFA